MYTFRPRVALFLATVLAITSASFAKTKWYYGETDGFAVYSSAGKNETQKVISNLRDARAVLGTLMPSLAKEQTVPLRVVVCKGTRIMDTFAPLYKGKPKKVGGFFTKDFEGALLVIRTDFDDDLTKHVIYHEYIHYLTRNSGVQLPPWLGEGVAELFATPSKTKDGLIVVGSAPPGALYQISSRSLIPMARLFSVSHDSPEYNSDQHGAGIFYAQSWAFLHYLMFGETDLPEKSYEAILKHVFSGRQIDETFLENTLGFGFEELETRLKKYCNGGKFFHRTFQLDETKNQVEFEPRLLSEAEVNLMVGMITLTVRAPADAYPYLARAAKELPENPTTAAYLAYHSLVQDQLEFAHSELERSISLGAQSPHTYLNYAKTLLRQKNDGYAWQSDTLSKDETVQILTLLFQAKSMGGAFEQTLYESIGETWLSSVITPEASHISVLVEGVYAFPSNKRIGLYLATLYVKTGNLQEARRLIDHYYPGPMDTTLRASFRNLAERLKETEASL